MKVEIDEAHIDAMKHSPVRNYVIPGLTSWLIGGHGEAAGTVRLFTCEREHEEPICPHSHRFDFECVVLAGSVRNRIWDTRMYADNGDMYRLKKLCHYGEFGKYQESDAGLDRFGFVEKRYIAGSRYAMRAEQIHSIYFSRGAKVLFFEGAKRLDESYVLEPVVDGEVIPTFWVDSWMFKTEQAK